MKQDALPAVADMAFDVESSNKSGPLTSVSSATFSHTVTAANKLIITISAGDGTQSERVASGVTWNGVACSHVQIKHETVGNSYETADIWQLDNPDTGTHNIVVTMGGTCDQLAAGVTGFTDADATLGTASTNEGTAADPTVTVVDTASGNIVVSVIASDRGGNALTEQGTLIWEEENIGADSNFGAQYQTATGANTVCWWDENATLSGWAVVGVAVKAAAAGGATKAVYTTLTGAGQL